MHEYYNRLTDKVCLLPPLYNGQWELLYNYSTLFSFKSRGKTDGAMNFGFIEIWINFLSGELSTYFLKNYLETHNVSHTLFCSYMRPLFKKSILQNPKYSTKKIICQNKFSKVAGYKMNTQIGRVMGGMFKREGTCVYLWLIYVEV